MASWNIGVKRLGGEDPFSITVSPDAPLAKLHDEIEDVTGLKASQQRLIYRGRIIGGGGNGCGSHTEGQGKIDEREAVQKIRDVLSNGHTIHLVPRPAEIEPSESSAATVTAATSGADTGARDGSSGSSGSSSTTSLLAALLGLGSTSSNTDASTTQEENSGSLSQQLQRLRSAQRGAREARIARRRYNRPTYRLNQSDIVVPDPGTLEPVRQGLLTLHTLLDATPSASNGFTEGNRHFYRGQWIDCRDTINQWLEATIVDIVGIDDVLPRQLRDFPRRRRRRFVEPTSDAPVTANDFEGRMRLYLEPCDDYDMEGEWNGYRQRENNDGVQLLLIHYNGWASRWDEWIRSDSERIRHFRTRTRHSATAVGALPRIESSFANAPSTNFRENDEGTERAALLPELRRIVSVVNETLAQAVVRSESDGQRPVAQNSDLPWIPDNCEDEGPPIVLGDELESCGGRHEATFNRRDVERLAPVLDRLGRVLVDVAPHVASYAASLPKKESPEPQRCTSGESNVVIVGEAGVEDGLERVGSDVFASSLGAGMFSLPTRVSQPNVVLASDSAAARTSHEEEQALDDLSMLDDPDNSDFLAGAVNTSRGESRRGRGSGGSGEDVSSLLGAYLAAASLSSLLSTDEGEGNNEQNGIQAAIGRAMRQRENNAIGGVGGGEGGGGGGTGIDIHIHAIVTGPGVGPGMGLAVLGNAQDGTPTRVLGGSTSGNSTLRSETLSAEAPQPSDLDEEEMGIFSDLYSETPSPADPNSDDLVKEGTGSSSPSPVGAAEVSLSIPPSSNDGSPTTTFLSAATQSSAGRSSSPAPRTPRRVIGSTAEVGTIGATPSPRRGGNVITRLFRRNTNHRSPSSGSE